MSVPSGRPVIAFSTFESHLTSVFSSCRFLQSCFFLVCHMAILVNPTRSILFAYCIFDVALSPPWFPAQWLPVTSIWICLFSCFGFACLLHFEKIPFYWLQSSNGLSVLFPRSAPNHPIPRPAHLFRPLLLLDSDQLSHTTTVGPLFSPENFRSPRLADWKKKGADTIASPSSLFALLTRISCSARSIEHVGDLYPDSSFSYVSWMTVISSCSRSNHPFRKTWKFQLLLTIVHPRAASCM